MKRFAYKKLIAWKSDTSRKPLLVQGARQVGKTYLLKEFSRNEFPNCAYCNFEETPALATLFNNDVSPAKLISTLSAYTGMLIQPKTTLLFFDEIQTCPRALTSLKYFQEQMPGMHVVAAGSLLGVSVGKTSSFPVGKVSFLTLHPMSFLEFLEAIDQEPLSALLREKKEFESLSGLLHEKLSDLFKIYLFIGGMPEVVQKYRETEDYIGCRTIQKEILKSYERDFSKYTTPVQAMRVSEIWRSLPAHLARENKKFKYSDVRKHGRASQFESAMEWLRSAGLLYTSINVSVPKLPLAGYEDAGRFKAYVLDCGLLGAMVDLSSRVIVEGNSIYAEYKGAFVENFIASLLAPQSDGALHYWTSEHIAEVDFIVECEGELLPLEVKSGMMRSIKGLRVYAEKYHPFRLYRASPRNFERRDDFVNIPLYAIELFPGLR